MTKLARDTLADIAARALVAFIRERGLQPGDALPSETQLAERFGVSRPVVREALQLLHGRGLLDARRHRGATVSRPAGQQLAAFVEHHLLFDRFGTVRLLELRRGIEVESARLAAERADVAARERLHATVAVMAGALHDVDAYATADVAFHDLIAEASGNALIANLLATLRSSARETMEVGLRSRLSDAELEQVQRSHEHVADAIGAGDADAAVRAMARHFDDALRTVERSLRADRRD